MLLKTTLVLLQKQSMNQDSEELMCAWNAYGKYIQIQQNNQQGNPIFTTLCEIQLLTSLLTLLKRMLLKTTLVLLKHIKLWL